MRAAEEEKAKPVTEQTDQEEQKITAAEKAAKLKKIDLIPPRPRAANILQY